MRTRARERRWVPSHHPEHAIHRKTEVAPEVKWSDNLQSCYGNDSCDGPRLLEQLAQYRPVADRFVIAVAAHRKLSVRRQRGEHRNEPPRGRRAHFATIPV